MLNSVLVSALADVGKSIRDKKTAKKPNKIIGELKILLILFVICAFCFKIKDKAKRLGFSSKLPANSL